MAVPIQTYPQLPIRQPLSVGFGRYSLNFDGITNRVQVNHNILTASPNATFEWVMWMPLQSTNWNRLFDDNGGCRFYLSDLGLFDGWTGFIGDGAAGWLMFRAARWDFINQYIHFVIQANGTTGQYVSYVNAVYNGARAVAFSAVTLDDLFIGCQFNAAQFWEGQIAYLRIYGDLLTAAEIRYNMLNYHNPIRDNLELWLPMEEGNGLVAADQSGNGYDGDLLTVADPPTWVRNQGGGIRVETDVEL